MSVLAEIEIVAIGCAVVVGALALLWGLTALVGRVAAPERGRLRKNFADCLRGVRNADVVHQCVAELPVHGLARGPQRFHALPLAKRPARDGQVGKRPCDVISIADRWGFLYHSRP